MTNITNVPALYTTYVDCVRDFGADPTGATDSTTKIQAAIDFAATNSIRKIFLPSGQYVTSQPLFVDTPSNLRGSAAAWNSGTAYVVGNVVTFNGIPWICQVNNTNNQPILPPRVGLGPGGTGSIPANAIVEYRTQYWKNISGGTASQSTLIFGGFNGSIWQAQTIFWLPTIVSPTSNNYSPIFEGVGMDSSQTNWGTIIKPTFSNFIPIIMSPGQGVEITGIQIIGPLNPNDAFSYDIALSPNGAGIGLTGPGSSRSLVDKCGIYNYYSGVRTGANVDGNCDSNTIRKCTFSNCNIGADFKQTQNFINRVDDCQVNTRIGVASVVGAGATITGGNFSLNLQGTTNKAYTISSVSMASNGDVTATISGPDAYLAAHAFNRFALVTPFYGVLPFTLTSYVEATGVITISLAPCYLTTTIGGSFTATAELQTEIAALTTLYAAKTNIAYFGTGIKAYGVHHEQDGSAPTTLLWCDEGFGGNPYSFISGLLFNYDPTFASLGPANTANANSNAAYYVQMTMPFIYVNSGSVKFDGNSFGFQVNTPLLILHNVASRLEMQNWDHGFFNILPFNSAIFGSGGVSPNGWAFGSGEFDRPTSFATQSVSNGGNSTYFNQLRASATRYWGWRPAVNANAFCGVDHLSTIEQPTLPVLNSGGDVLPYILPWGGSNYSMIDGDGTLFPTETEFRSNHFGYTYGQTLTTNWSFKGGSGVVNFSGGTGNIFPGLVLIFSSVGGGTDRCVVTGVYDQAKYATVVNIDNTPSLPGTAGTTFSGSTITQQPFSIQHLNNFNRDVPPTLLTGVSGTQGAYSTRLLNSSYAGAAVNIRRSSDNTTSDIGFVLGELDVGAFNAFVGAGQGFVHTWYDQSGNAANLVQATNGNQPQLVLNAAPNGRPALLFVPANSTNLKATLVTGPTTTFTFEGVMQILPVNNVTIWELDKASNVEQLALTWFNPNLQFWFISIGAPQRNNRQSLWSHIAMLQSATAGAAYINGSLTSLGTFALNNGGPTFLTVGANGAATPAAFCSAYIAEMVFINGDFLNTDRPIRQNQRLYWDV